MTKHLLTFLIPTNQPENIESKFLSCLDVFEPIKEYITFCFNFQPPYTRKGCERLCSWLSHKGFESKYIYSEYNFTPESFSFIKMREDAASIAPTDTLYFVDYDDDIIYYKDKVEEAQKVWFSLIIQCLKNEHIGSARIDTWLCKATAPKHFVEENIIYSSYEVGTGTGLGLIYKNLYGGHILPENLLYLRGSKEDKLNICIRAHDEQYPIWCYCPTLGEHTDNKVIKSRTKYGTKQFNHKPGYIAHYIETHELDMIDNLPVNSLIAEEAMHHYDEEPYISERYTSIDLDRSVDDYLKEFIEVYDKLK